VTHTGTRSTLHWTRRSPQLNKWLTPEHVLQSTEHWGLLNYTRDSHRNKIYSPLNTGVASTQQVTHTGTRSTLHWTLGLPQLNKCLTSEHALLSTEHWGLPNSTSDSHRNKLHSALNIGVASTKQMTHKGTRSTLHWTLGSPQLNKWLTAEKVILSIEHWDRLTQQVTHTGTRCIVHWTLGSLQLNKWLTTEQVLLSTGHWDSLNPTSDSHRYTLYSPLNTGVSSTIHVSHTGIRSTVHWTLGSLQLNNWLTPEEAILSTEHWGHFNSTSSSHRNKLYCPLYTGIPSTQQVTYNGTRSTLHWTLGSLQLNKWLTPEQAILSTEHWGHFNSTSDSHRNKFYCPLYTGIPSTQQVTHTGTRATIHWTLGSLQLNKWLTPEHVLLSTGHWGRFYSASDPHRNTLYSPLNTGVSSTIPVTYNRTRSTVHWTQGSPQLNKWLTP